MGVVYRARDTRLGRPVAVKLLSDAIVKDHSGLERFRREAQAISALNHPNVCTLYDIGEQEGRPYLVMELMEGRTLKERIAAEPFSNGQLLAIMIPILEALEAALSVGIVHRDIKPANIFLCRQGPVKILDFGLAKSSGTEFAAHADIAKSLTAPGTTVGTISYMSPEQIRGGNVDARSDLFACGVVLYLMATRTLPFSGDGWAATLEAVMNFTPRPARELTPDLSPEIERKRSASALPKRRRHARRTAANQAHAGDEKRPRGQAASSFPAQTDIRRRRIRCVGDPGNRWLVLRRPQGPRDLAH